MNRIKEAGFTVIEAISAFLVVVIGPAMLWGWIANIVKLSHSTFAPITPIVVIRMIGIFVVPLGCVMGYIG